MKTIIGALVGVIVIVAIVLFTRGHKAAAPASGEESHDGASSETISPSDDRPTSANPDTTPGTIPTELKVTVIKQGTGDAAKAGDTVDVNYTGKLSDGTTFDSNVDPKFGHVEPFSFTLGANSVIQGWEQGVLGMKVGEKRHLSIPPSLGYGKYGMPPVIPGFAVLEFDVEVVGIHHK